MPGYTGKNCDLDLDECEQRVCVEANTKKCLNEIGSFRCICHEGYHGKTCEEDINECEPVKLDCNVEDSHCGAPRYLHTCIKGQGTCENYDGGFRCNCREGYKGE